MTQSDWKVRIMGRTELPWLIQWAAAEGWNPGRYDAECFYSADPRGFFVGELAGQPVGGISGVQYGTAYGFLGFYIVQPEFRGRGWGPQIWSAAMDYLSGRTVGLDAVTAQEKIYERAGFARAFRSIRYQLEGGPRPILTGPQAFMLPVQGVPFGQLLEYDRSCFFDHRPEFLTDWLQQPEAVTMAAILEGEVAGYTVMRRCLNGWKIGPLFADEPEIAEDLLLAVIRHAPDEPVFLDIPEPNQAGMELARRFAMTPVFETVRMYNREAPALPLHRIFGITSFELG